MNKLNEQKTVSLSHQDINNCKTVETDDKKIGPSYFSSIRVGEKWKKETKRRLEWAKKGEKIYTLPLNTANEAKLIYYIDQLPSVKPYICDLIRKDMKNHDIKFTKSWRGDYNNNIGTKRMFSLKFSVYKDTDILEYLKKLQDQHISKRAYIIALLEKDISDTGFRFPEELTKYNKENKIVKDKITDEFYRHMCYYIETEIKKGNTTINNKNAYNFINGRMLIDSITLENYWNQYFVKTGALKFQEGNETIYDIDVKKFNELVYPNAIVV